MSPRANGSVARRMGHTFNCDTLDTQWNWMTREEGGGYTSFRLGTNPHGGLGPGMAGISRKSTDAAILYAQTRDADGWAFLMVMNDDANFSGGVMARGSASQASAGVSFYAAKTNAVLECMLNHSIVFKTDGVIRGSIFANDFIWPGGIVAAGLPTTNPAQAGRLWNDGGTVKVSAG
jgi:hypothetical protein